MTVPRRPPDPHWAVAWTTEVIQDLDHPARRIQPGPAPAAPDSARPAWTSTADEVTKAEGRLRGLRAWAADVLDELDRQAAERAPATSPSRTTSRRPGLLDPPTPE